MKQIFGHTETREPVLTETYVALDTTNCGDTCYLYDTEVNEIVKLKLPQRAIRADIDWGDEDIVAAENLTQEMVEKNRADLQDDLYWGFADGEQFVVVKAKTAKEAMHIASSYWHMGQTITPTGVLPLNAREISNKRNYKYDKILWQAGPGSNEYFYDDMHKEKS